MGAPQQIALHIRECYASLVIFGLIAGFIGLFVVLEPICKAAKPCLLRERTQLTADGWPTSRQATDAPRSRVSFCPESESERNAEHPNGIDRLVPTVQTLRNNQ